MSITNSVDIVHAFWEGTTGILGTAPDQQDIRHAGTAMWAVREDGKLLCNWVERASFELYRRLTDH